MKPYYQDDYATIYHGDCREILPKIGRVDFLFADPQYNVGFGYANNGDSNKGYASSAKEWFGLFDETCVAITPGMDNVMLWPQPRGG